MSNFAEKLNEAQRQAYGLEKEAAKKLKPSKTPWWLVFASLFLLIIVALISTFFAETTGVVPGSLVVFFLSVYLPKKMWRNSKAFAAKEEAYSEACRSIDAKYRKLAASSSDAE